MAAASQAKRLNVRGGPFDTTNLFQGAIFILLSLDSLRQHDERFLVHVTYAAGLLNGC
jgi:hypothetical protein